MGPKEVHVTTTDLCLMVYAKHHNRMPKNYKTYYETRSLCIVCGRNLQFHTGMAMYQTDFGTELGLLFGYAISQTRDVASVLMPQSRDRLETH